MRIDTYVGNLVTFHYAKSHISMFASFILNNNKYKYVEWFD
jgi:hypothetical protein